MNEHTHAAHLPDRLSGCGAPPPASQGNPLPGAFYSLMPINDTFGIGIHRAARIRMDIAQQQMGEAYSSAFAVGYVPPEWRAMRRRQFATARADYEACKEIITGGATNEPDHTPAQQPARSD